MSAPTVSTRLAQIAEQSKREPEMVFTTLAHHMDEDFLTEAFHQLRKDAAAGIDEMTVAEYSLKLKENIADLHQRLVNRKYRAQPARRVWIPKSDGSQRPLAILYTIHRAASLASPTWSILSPVTMNASGAAVFEDTDAALTFPAFYRAVGN